MKTSAEFSNNLDLKYQYIIKSMLAPLENHNVSVYAMGFNFRENFYLYKPLKSYRRRFKLNISQVRQKKLALEFAKIDVEFSKRKINVKFCIMKLKEGGSIMFTTENSCLYCADIKHKAN